MYHIIHSFILIIALFWSSMGMTEETSSDITNSGRVKPPISIRGGDMDSVSRIVIDGISKNGYQLVPLNNQLDVVFTDFEYSFMDNELASIGILNNVKKVSILEKDNLTILRVEYKCACQGDFYKWNNKKLVLDVFSLDAISNPLKVKKKETNKENPPPPQLQAKENQENHDGENDENDGQKKITSSNPREKKQDTDKKTDKKLTPQQAITQNFENYLTSLVDKASKSGIVEFKDQQSDDNTPKKEEKKNIPDNTKTNEITSNDKKDLKQETSSDLIEQIINAQDSNESNEIVLDGGDSEEIDNTITDNPQEISENIQISNDSILSTAETEMLLPTDTDMFENGTTECLPDAAFQLPPNDPNFETFYDKISDYRNDMLGEFDEVNPENALKLASHYISYGLGEEALQVLTNFPTPEHRGNIARSIAELLTNRTPAKGSVFSGSDDCEGNHSLWTAYRYYKLGKESKAAELSDFVGVADSLKLFPQALRNQIGTALALNLVRQGSYDRADEIVNMIATSSGQFSPYVLLVRGLIDAKNGLSKRAITTLEGVLNNTQGTDQQMAGLALAELKLATGVELSVRDTSILEEVIFLKRRELIGLQALALVAENESRHGNFNAAFNRLSQKVYNNPAIKDPAQIKADQLFKRIAVSGEGNDNPNTLNIYWKYPQLIPSNPVYLVSFANKLYDHGYDAASVEVLENIENAFPEYTLDNDITYPKAKALFRLGEYRQVVDTMKKPYTQDIDYMSLKAEAYHKLGKNKKAIKTLSQFNDKKSILNIARYGLAGKQWAEANKSFETAKSFGKNDELYYASKASAYMSGYQYPGKASDYKKAEDIVFHQPANQAKSVEDVVNETDSLIDFVHKRSQVINDVIHKKEITKKTQGAADIRKKG